MNTHLFFFFFWSPYPDSKDDLCILLLTELWMGNCMKIVNKKTTWYLAKTHTRVSGWESCRSLSLSLLSFLEFLGLFDCLLCSVISHFVWVAFFFFSILPMWKPTEKYVIQVCAPNVCDFFFFFAALMGSNRTYAVNLCVTSSLFVILYPPLFQRISIFEHTSRVLISNIKKSIPVFVISLIRDVFHADWEEGRVSRHGYLTNRFLIAQHSSPGFYKSVWRGVLSACVCICHFCQESKNKSSDMISSVFGKKWRSPFKITSCQAFLLWVMATNVAYGPGDPF